MTGVPLRRHALLVDEGINLRALVALTTAEPPAMLATFALLALIVTVSARGHPAPKK